MADILGGLDLGGQRTSTSTSIIVLGGTEDNYKYIYTNCCTLYLDDKQKQKYSHTYCLTFTCEQRGIVQEDQYQLMYLYLAVQKTSTHINQLLNRVQRTSRRKLITMVELILIWTEDQYKYIHTSTSITIYEICTWEYRGQVGLIAPVPHTTVGHLAQWRHWRNNLL